MEGFSELRWTILETFAKVTRVCEELQDTVISHPISQQVLPFISNSNNTNIERRNRPSFNSPTSRNTPSVPHQGLDEITHLYLTRWAAGIVERASAEFSYRLNSPARPFAYNELSSGQSTPFSDGIFDTESSNQDSSRVPEIDILCMSREPLTPVEWIGFYTKSNSLQAVTDGVLLTNIQTDPKDILKRIFMGGIDHDLRPQVWKYVLGVYPWKVTEKEKNKIQKIKSEEYWKLKQKWMDPLIQNSEDFKEQKFRIEKDVLRTDRHVLLFAPQQENDEDRGLPGSNEVLEQMKDILMCYHFYNQELGYVQGMSDLLSPLYAVFNDEVDTFWCFVAFMDKVKENFSRDQQGMHNQLQTLSLLVKLIAPSLYLHLVDIGADNMFSCFRWILIWYKREFSFEHTMQLWEVIWTNHYTEHFHLFVALAILEIHQHVIVTYLRGLDEVLKYTNDLSMSMDFRTVLRRAELMFKEFESRMKAYRSREAEASSNQQHDNNHGTVSSDEDHNTLQIITPPPEVHSYTVSPSSPPFGPSKPILTSEEFASLHFILPNL